MYHVLAQFSRYLVYYDKFFYFHQDKLTSWRATNVPIKAADLLSFLIRAPTVHQEQAGKTPCLPIARDNCRLQPLETDTRQIHV